MSTNSPLSSIESIDSNGVPYGDRIGDATFKFGISEKTLYGLNNATRYVVNVVARRGATKLIYDPVAIQLPTKKGTEPKLLLSYPANSRKRFLEQPAISREFAYYIVEVDAMLPTKSQISRLDLLTNNEEVIEEFAGYPSRATHLRRSPDGRLILYLSCQPTNAGACSLKALDADAPTVRTFDMGISTRTFTFIGERLFVNGELYTLNFDGAKLGLHADFSTSCGTDTSCGTVFCKDGGGVFSSKLIEYLPGGYMTSQRGRYQTCFARINETTKCFTTVTSTNGLQNPQVGTRYTTFVAGLDDGGLAYMYDNTSGELKSQFVRLYQPVALASSNDGEFVVLGDGLYNDPWAGGRILLNARTGAIVPSVSGYGNGQAFYSPVTKEYLFSSISFSSIATRYSILSAPINNMTNSSDLGLGSDLARTADIYQTESIFNIQSLPNSNDQRRILVLSHFGNAAKMKMLASGTTVAFEGLGYSVSFEKSSLSPTVYSDSQQKRWFYLTDNSNLRYFRYELAELGIIAGGYGGTSTAYFDISADGFEVLYHKEENSGASSLWMYSPPFLR